MLYKRTGYPEIDEIVLCRVTKIYPSSVFVDLLEYGRSGIVHISEVSPGRIRNLRDFVSEGRQIVCKILRLDKEKGHIDLSLRRVNSNQRREKLDEVKQEMKAESLMKNLSKKLKVPVDKIYRQVSEKVFEEYSHIYLCFKDVASEDADLKKTGIDQNIAEELTAAILDKFKPKKITIGGEITAKTYVSEGVEKVKKALTSIEKISETITVYYLGGGRFKLTIEDFDYKPAEKNLKKILDILEKFNDKNSVATFERDKE